MCCAATVKGSVSFPALSCTRSTASFAAFLPAKRALLLLRSAPDCRSAASRGPVLSDGLVPSLLFLCFGDRVCACCALAAVCLLGGVEETPGRRSTT